MLFILYDIKFSIQRESQFKETVFRKAVFSILSQASSFCTFEGIDTSLFFKGNGFLIQNKMVINIPNQLSSICAAGDGGNYNLVISTIEA